VHPDNPVYASDNGILFNKDKTKIIWCPHIILNGDYTVPDSMVTIDAWAFYNCEGLTSVTIPNSVVFIEDYAFAHCENLISVTISMSVIEIGTDAFDGCPAFITVHPDNPFYTSENGKLKMKHQ
jgi:hypothetical protein